MILGDSATAAATQQGQRRLAIDEIFRRSASKHPEKLALVDPPNRNAFTDGEPRRLTYGEADRMVAAIAGRLRSMGLSSDTVVGIQLPNVVENILTVLGVLRAGMIAAPLPLLWRRADAIAALGRVGARALITCGRVGRFNYCQSAMRIASEIFSIRYVCGFGQRLPDGVVPFDDLFAAERLDPIPPLDPERQTSAAAHIGLITFDSGAAGIVAVARSHLETIAGGLAVTLESRLAQGASLVSTLAPSSFAGTSLTLMPWLLTGGTLCLHHPFDPRVLAQQRREQACAAAVLPGAVALRLGQAGAFAAEDGGTVIGAWSAPAHLATSPAWREPKAALVDVAIFGETGLVAARRGAGGRPAPMPSGPIAVPRDSPGGIVVAELIRTPAGTVALRGPMVPRRAFPPGIERSGLPHFAIDALGMVDTGYGCRIDSGAGGLVVTGPPPGLVSVGGYRFALRELREAVGKIDSAATLAALPDPVIGQRLIGNAEKRDVVRAALNAVGVNPLVAAAFRDRGDHTAAPRSETPSGVD
jgi:hypothetical protein